MARVAPIHSANEPVYHNNDKCTERNNIEARNRLSGDGGKRLCEHCERLNKPSR